MDREHCSGCSECSGTMFGEQCSGHVRAEHYVQRALFGGSALLNVRHVWVVQFRTWACSGTMQCPPPNNKTVFLVGVGQDCCLRHVRNVREVQYCNFPCSGTMVNGMLPSLSWHIGLSSSGRPSHYNMHASAQQAPRSQAL